MISKTLKAIVLVSLLTVYGFSGKAQSRIELAADFERDPIRQGWDNQESCCSYSMTRSTAFRRTGTSSMRVEVRKSDPDVAGSKRAELTDNSFPMPPQTNIRWWSFSNFLPNDFVRDSVKEMVAQWHFKATSGATIGASPPIGLTINKGNWEVSILYDSVDINIDRGANIKVQHFDLGPWQRGVWNDWVFNINYSYNDDGYVKVWRNGQLVLDYKGKCWYKGAYDPMFKIGLYKWAWDPSYTFRPGSITTSRVYYVDHVKTGNIDAEFSDFFPIDGSNLLPKVMLGNNQTLTLPTNNATLNGSASFDPDGSISSYSWSQEFGPSQATMSATNTPSVIVSRMIAGLYRFRLTVRDNKGAISSNTMDIQINGTISNRTPVAVPGKKIFTNSSFVSLSGNGSYDPDGNIVSYSWAQYAGPSTATIASPSSINTTVSNLVNGSYYFVLQVIDNRGGISRDFVNISVGGSTPPPSQTPPPSNTPPTANAGWNQNLVLPVNAATLNGSGSSDSDGSITSYRWTQIAGPSTATMSNQNNVTNVVSNLIAGTYTFQLTVTDNQGATATATMNVNVSGGTNTPPVANAGWNQRLTLPTNAATLNGSASSDSDGTIVTYRWTQIAGPTTAPMSNPNSVTNVVSNMVAGTYTFRLTVTDNQGATATADMSVILTNGTNTPPVANAGWNQRLTLPTNAATLNGSASSDSDGTIVTYQWTQIAGPTTAPMSNPNSVTNVVSNMVAGTYTFRLTVTDNQGATATADMSVILTNGTNTPPVANAGWNQRLTLPTNAATLNGSASSDSDGTIVTYRWTQVAGPTTAPMSNPNSVTNVVSNMVAGTYTFRLTVTDNQGATATADMSVILSTGNNQPPIANVSWNQTLTWPVNSATLNGSGSSDPDGTIVSYRWTQVSGPTTATMNDPNLVRPIVTNMQIGTYTFQLTVTDNGGLSASASMRVIINSTTGQASSNSSGIEQTSEQLFNQTGSQLQVPKQFKVYPNPANQFITVDFGETTAQEGQLRIYATNGALLYQEKIQGINTLRNKRINVSSFNQGMYILVLLLDTGEKRTGKFELVK